MPRKLTLEQFLHQALRHHGSAYDYSKAQYVNFSTKVEIICNQHGSFLQTPRGHIVGQQGCPRCANEYKTTAMRHTTDQFIEQSRSVHGALYDYSKSMYVDMGTKVSICCKEHGTYLQTPSNHIHNKAGCPKCDNKNMSTADFIRKAKNIHGECYDYTESIYINVTTPIKIKCSIHGTFMQKPNAHLHGRCGCQMCNSSKGEQVIRRILDSASVDYEMEKTFDRCRSILPLRFDFYLPRLNTIIEFDGIQHFKYFKNWHKSPDGFKDLLRRDLIKTHYCATNNIRLIRIPYYDMDKIEDILEERGVTQARRV